MHDCLIVVDMQNDFVSGSLGSNEAKYIVNSINEKINLYKKHGKEVVFTRDTHDENYMGTLEGKKLPVPHCIKGSYGWNIIKEYLPFLPDSKVFDKPTFGSKELAEYLSSKKYKSVEFCGVCTGICVISNVCLTRAYNPECDIFVSKNCVACVTPDSNESTLCTMKTLQVNITE